jgi:hypothetical protein
LNKTAARSYSRFFRVIGRPDGENAGAYAISSSIFGGFKRRTKTGCWELTLVGSFVKMETS